MLYHRPNLPWPQCLVPRQWDNEHLQRRAVAAALHRAQTVQPLAAGLPAHPMERDGRHGRPKFRQLLFLDGGVPQFSNPPAIDRPGRRRHPARHHRIPSHSHRALPGRNYSLAPCGCAPESRPLHRFNRADWSSLPGRCLQQFFHACLWAYRYPANLLTSPGRSSRAGETRHPFQLVAVLRLRNPGRFPRTETARQSRRGAHSGPDDRIVLPRAL
jgi:hypothetical protein